MQFYWTSFPLQIPALRFPAYTIMDKLCPLKVHMLMAKTSALVSQNVTVFVDGAFVDVIKVKWDHIGGPQFSLTSVLGREGNLGLHWETRKVHAQRKDHLQAKKGLRRNHTLLSTCLEV